MRALLRALATVGALLYVPPVVTWLLLRWGVGESVPWVGMLNAVGLLWFLPLLFLLPLALLSRTRWTALWLLPVAGVGLWLFGGDFVPAVSAAPSDAPRLSVLSFNTLVSNRSLAEVEALILEERPDVIAIQELSFEMADYLARGLAEAYPYQLLHPWSDPRGIGIFSRYPLAEGPALDIERWDRWAMSGAVEVEGQRVVIVNVHLWPTGTVDRRLFARALRLQRRQLADLEQLLVGIEGAVLVVGDLNASPTNESYEQLDRLLDDAWRTTEAGAGFTWPAESLGRFGYDLPPLLRIDYLWYRGPIAPTAVRILPATGSDHLPLLGEFVVGDR